MGIKDRPFVAPDIYIRPQLSFSGFFGIANQPIGGKPECASEARKKGSNGSKPNSGIGEPSVSIRFFLPIFFILIGFFLSILGGNYLYRKREIIATEFFSLGCFLGLCGLWLWLRA